ncbi:MAG TPA: hypothetical protein PKE45_12370 [Caldilineaceae bacterium]|nr:hypothetical protein [Caldilineaceae bacterium]
MSGIVAERPGYFKIDVRIYWRRGMDTCRIAWTLGRLYGREVKESEVYNILDEARQ